MTKSRYRHHFQLALALAVLLASCTANPRRAVRPSSRTYHHPSHRSDPTTATDLSRGILPPEGAAPGKPLPPPKPVRIAPVNEWLSLAGWSRANLAVQPRPIDPKRRTWEMRAPTGDLQLLAQSRQARYDGLDLYLGFAPNSNSRDLQMHRLDLEKNVLPLMINQAGWRPIGRRIVIDPGHGGRNAGTISVLNHTEEKDYTLDWALRLAPLLQAKGWEVMLTRTRDLELPIPERVAFADQVQADLFVSLHFNSSAPNRTRSGIETYCLTPAGLPSTLVRGGPDDPTLFYPNNHFDPANLQVAVRIHRALIRATGAVDRGIRRARFMAVIRDQQRPAVLVEGGFLSHPQEARRIADPAHRQRLAQAVADALTRTPPARAGGSQIASP